MCQMMLCVTEKIKGDLDTQAVNLEYISHGD